MRAEAVVVLGAAGALFFLGILGFMITEVETENQLIPGGDPENPDDYTQVQTQITPFKGVGISSILFGAVIFLLFLGVAVVARKSR
ncbi:MAG: hypothetical protein ACE5IO_10145 [Thermoplasmata archaeon]